MAAGAWTPTNSTRTKILNGTFDWQNGSWKVALFTSASNLGVSSTTYAGVTNEVANANGYTTGGQAVAFTMSGTTSVTASFTTNPSWVASGGSIVARYAAIYKVGGDIAFFCLLDSTPADVTALSGNILQIDSDGSPSPVFTLA
ncbi:hypothetical protein A5747_13300 [Mycobacterium sp. IS-836]|uniref:hypothetical protein n=1 Tax=Mycobacterium sp. IS-836 TaxID=1834160 RepID=UPI00096ED4BB|nr:hypothetical protein [Mycobacterium sp. IS-836]OMC55364.1 hypothetical protein A5747_13300 [Mycobacterium sp. IS-836]